MTTTQQQTSSLTDDQLVAKYEAACNLAVELNRKYLDTTLIDSEVDLLVDELMARGLA